MRHVLTALAALAAPVSAQVLITEVHPSEGWIEIQNRSPSPAELTGWSLYCTTPRSAYPGTYWWAFPTGTVLAPQAFARVHWFAPFRLPTPTQFWTGDGNHNFLFGLGGERLAPAQGSVALLASVVGAAMSDPGVYRDWLSWGSAGREREQYAIAGGRWYADTFLPVPPVNASIALGADPSREPTPISDYYIDATPTPGSANQQGAQLVHFGAECAVGVANAPTLEARGIPATGNSDFALRVHGTDGFRQQTLVFLLGFEAGQGLILPIDFMTCPIWVDLGGPLLTLTAPTTPGQSHTDLPLSLEGLTVAGWTLYVQVLAGVLPISPYDHAATAGLAITFGG